MEIANEFPKRPALDTIFEEEFTPNERIIKALNKIEVISRNILNFSRFHEIFENYFRILNFMLRPKFNLKHTASKR